MSTPIKFRSLNVPIPIRIYFSFGQLFLSFYRMDSQRGEKVEWTDDEVQDLIELLEEKPCLWDIFSNEYTKKDVKERVYVESAEHIDSSSAIVKAKIIGLRAQLGREKAKELKTKSGQATNEKCVSKWVFFAELKFLRPAMAATKSQNSISTQNNDFNGE